MIEVGVALCSVATPPVITMVKSSTSSDPLPPVALYTGLLNATLTELLSFSTLKDAKVGAVWSIKNAVFTD